MLFTRDYISDSDALDESQFPIYKTAYTKTGLGSSACVLVSLVKNILRLLQDQPLDEDNFNRRVNVVSQIANLAAQKKIGSNFDISVAVYGTHLYRNILPHKVSVVLENPLAVNFEQLLQIDPCIKKVERPPG